MKDIVMHAPYTRTCAAEADRHAFNVAFEALGLSWHWDASTYASVQARGRDGLRSYLEEHHPHLLRAYDVDFLAIAIETEKARCCADVPVDLASVRPYAGRAADSFSFRDA